MKKTILNKNYSLIVLLILTLYLIYINIPDEPMTMTGGSSGYLDPNNPLIKLDKDKLIKHLESHSMIFKILNNYLWVYIIFIVILIALSIYFGSSQYDMQGIPAAGINPKISWDNEGINFMNYFYQMAKQKYGLFTPNSSPNLNDEILVTFEKQFDNFILTNNGAARDAMDLYCNIVSPCNICNCSGPDPNYSGPSSSTPMIPFQGSDPKKGACSAKVAAKAKETMTGTQADATKYAANIVKYQEQRGISNLMFTRIPDCCCQLWQNLTSNNITPTTISAALSNLPSGSNIGIPDHTGCEPKTTGQNASLAVNGPSSSPLIPHQTKTGSNVYIADMIRSCLKKDNTVITPAFPDAGKTVSGGFTVSELSPHMKQCQTYDTKLDCGISYYHTIKNLNKYFTPSIIKNNTYVSGSLLTPNTNWTKGIWNETNKSAPVINVTKPTDWPTVAPFNTSGIVNTYWYKSPSSNINYQLNVNNCLYEISAYPVKTVDSTIYENNLTDSASIIFLENYLSSSNISSKTTFISGYYWFP